MQGTSGSWTVSSYREHELCVSLPYLHPHDQTCPRLRWTLTSWTRTTVCDDDWTMKPSAIAIKLWSLCIHLFTTEVQDIDKRTQRPHIGLASVPRRDGKHSRSHQFYLRVSVRRRQNQFSTHQLIWCRPRYNSHSGPSARDFKMKSTRMSGARNAPTWFSTRARSTFSQGEQRTVYNTANFCDDHVQQQHSFGYSGISKRFCLNHWSL